MTKKKICVKEQIVSVNSFDLSDYIISLHKKNNITLSLCKLQTIIFFYQIVSKTTHVIPFVDDDFLLKNNFIHLKDIEKKYKKEKTNIAKTQRHLTEAPFADFGSACKLLTAFTEYFKNYPDRLMRRLMRKMPIYQKLKIVPQQSKTLNVAEVPQQHRATVPQARGKKNSFCTEIIVKMEKKDFIKYYPLKRWEDGYNMIIDIDDKIPLFRL